MSYWRQRRRSRKARIELIPMIDCMFLLLTFFLYVRMTMTIQRGIPVDLASAVSGESAQEDRFISVSIDSSGQIYIDKRAVSEEELRSGLKFVALQASPKPVVVQADKGVLHERVIQVLDTARRSGVPQVVFSVEPAEE